MELRTLKYFLTVAHEGNMTRAAKVLFVTQPALSRQLKGLEDELGAQLFDRKSHTLELTEAGKQLARRAEEIVSLAERTAAEFSDTDPIISGDVYIGVGESYTSRFIAQVVRRVQQEHPQVRFHVRSGNSRDLGDKLDAEILDFCIFIQPADVSNYSHLPIPGSDLWGLYVRKDNPLASKTCITRVDLLAEPLICSEQTVLDSFSHNAFIDWFGEDFDALNIVGTYNLSYVATLLAAEGCASLVALQKQIRVDEASDLVFLPFEPKLEVASDLAWKKHKTFSPAAEAFLATAKSMAL